MDNTKKRLKARLAQEQVEIGEWLAKHTTGLTSEMIAAIALAHRLGGRLLELVRV